MNVGGVGRLSIRLMDEPIQPRLRAAIARLYAGPLDEFIRGRDALAKELRSARDRDAAAAVKGLRKPSRPAWALNRVAQGPTHLPAVLAALAGLVDAHTGSGDPRTAMTALRSAVRGFATAAEAASHSAGFSLDAARLSNAVIAVVADPAALKELQGGYLAEVPAAGSLDYLTLLPVRPKLEVSHSSRPVDAGPDPAEFAALREQARLANEEFEAAKRNAGAAAAFLSNAESERASASEQLRIAQAELEAAEQRLRFAHRDNEAAIAELNKAEARFHEVSTRLSSLGST